jgi:hypothetical protein
MTTSSGVSGYAYIRFSVLSTRRAQEGGLGIAIVASAAERRMRAPTISGSDAE